MKKTEGLPTKQEKKIWEKLINYYKGDISISGGHFIDFKNGFSIGENEIEKIIDKYLDIEEQIETYIDENNLDNVMDQEKIKAEFPEFEKYFSYNQAVLKNIEEFAVEYFKEYIEK